jgi:hypothetical protein
MLYIMLASLLSVFYDFSCLLDTDDEVRDRATFYVNVLKEKDKALSSAYILNGKFSHSVAVLTFKFELKLRWCLSIKD